MAATEPAGPLALMPPNAVVDDFLGDALRGGLLEWTLANRERFKPATVFRGDQPEVDRLRRSNLKLRDLGPLRSQISERLLEALPRLAGELGTRPPDEPSLELELTAYGDGAFYHPHKDIATGTLTTKGRAAAGSRLISAVYYFHVRPKSFEGGELRLFRWGAGEQSPTAGDYKEIEPTDNRLLAFLSWARHEVRPVRCPSRRFEDFRFALNCWYCGEAT